MTMRNVNFESAEKMVVVKARKSVAIINVCDSVDMVCRAYQSTSEIAVNNEIMAVLGLKDAIAEFADKPTLIVVRDSVSIMAREINNLLRKGLGQDAIVEQIMSHKSWLKGTDKDACESAVILLVDVLAQAHENELSLSIWKASSLVGFQVSFDTDEDINVPEGTVVDVTEGNFEYNGHIGTVVGLDFSQDKAELIKVPGKKPSYLLKRTGYAKEREFLKGMFQGCEEFLPARSAFGVDYTGTVAGNVEA